MTRRRLFRCIIFVIIINPSVIVYGFASEDRDFFVTFPDIELRPGVTCDIQLKVFVNENKSLFGETIFAVHGYTHTANTWKPFAEALFDKKLIRRDISRIVAIDMPGRGGSGLPNNLTFSELDLRDYVKATKNVMERLRRDLHIRPTIIVGHSQGGILVQMLQQTLRDQKTSLRKAMRIRHAILIAPAIPSPLPWKFADSGVAASLINSFIVPNDPILGTHIAGSAKDWLFTWFTNFSGHLHSKSPTSDKVEAKGYNAPEPLVASINFAGARRPFVEEGIFRQHIGTRLKIITYSQDTLFHPNEHSVLYTYLTENTTGAGVWMVEDDEAVHDLHVADPEFLINSLEGLF